MKSLYYWISGALFLLWFLSYMFFDAGSLVHLIFLLAVLVLLYSVFSNQGNTDKN